MNRRKVRAGQPASDIDWPEPEPPKDVEDEDARYTILAVVICAVLLTALMVWQIL